MTPFSGTHASERFWLTSQRLNSADPDDRIAAIRSLGAPESWSAWERIGILVALADLLKDERTDTYPYGIWQGDENEPAVRVCDEAAWMIARFLGSAGCGDVPTLVEGR